MTSIIITVIIFVIRIEWGISAVLYQINDNHESYLAIHFYVVQKIKWIESIVFSATGNIFSKVTQKYNKVDYEQVEAIIAGIVGEYSNLNQIIIGTPSIAEYGIIKHCDIPELENIPMKEKLESKFSLPVAIENDMHHKAYGYYKKTGNRDDVISLEYMPQFNIVDSFDEYYYEGMYQLAVDRKEF